MAEPSYKHGSEDKTGVLIANLGTPDAPTPKAVKRYLAQFLSDRRVVEFNPILWWIVLHGIILQTRPAKTAKAYEKIWRNDGSPLMYHSVAQTKAIQAQLDRRLRRPVLCALGMRYGEPSIAAAMRQLRNAGARRMLVVPMYPQYSATTTASIFDAVTLELQRWRWIPELRFVNDFYKSPGYIHALANSIQEHWQAFGQAERLLFSFHGIPQAYVDAGDPYACMCHYTARKVAERLQLTDKQWQICFQSRLGRQAWLKPYTDQVLQSLPKEGVKSVDIVCPGFSADCLETLEEIAMVDRDIFLQAGGERYHYISALNDRLDHIQALADVVTKHMQGWPETDPNWHASQDALDRETSRQTALAKGAKA